MINSNSKQAKIICNLAPAAETQMFLKMVSAGMSLGISGAENMLEVQFANE